MPVDFVNVKLCIVMIGHNESRTIGENLERFRDLCADMPKSSLIYIDSNSDDGSVDIVRGFVRENAKLNISCYQLRGESLNSAIARNAGIENLPEDSEYVFFLDGDVVFEKKFVFEAVNVLAAKSNIGTVTGLIKDVFINKSNNSVIRPGTSYDNKVELRKHGGIFITRSEVLKKTGKFDTKLVRHQDIDYCFRIRKNNYILKHSGVLLGEHFTVSYFDLKRFFENMLSGKYFSSGLLLQKYFFSRYLLDVLKCNKAALVRLAVIILMTMGLINILFFILGLVLFFVIVLRIKKDEGQSVLSKLLSFSLPFFLIAGLFNLCRKHKECQAVKII